MLVRSARVGEADGERADPGLERSLRGARRAPPEEHAIDVGERVTRHASGEARAFEDDEEARGDNLG